MTTKTIIKPLSLETYDVSNVAVASKYYDMPEYGFRSVNMSYNHENTTYDKFEVKVSGSIVKIFEPGANSKSKKKYAALLKVSDPTSIELFKTIDESLVAPIYSSRTTIFDGLKVGKTNLITKIKTEEDILKYRAKPLLDYNDQYQSYSLGFEFFSDKCTIVHSDNVEQEIRDADTVLGKLPQHSEVTMVLQISKLSINMKKCKWNPKATAMFIQCSGVGSGSSSPGTLSGLDINDVDTKNVTLGELKTNDYNGKCVPVKYNGRSLSLKLKDVEVRFMRNVNEDTGKTRFSLGLDLSEHRDKFEEIDNHILTTLFENQKDYFSKNDIEDDEELFANNFRGSLKEDKNGDRFTLWANIYASEAEDGTFDFDGKFFSLDEETPTVMTNEDVLNSVFSSTEALRTNLSVYIRYIWLGNDKSVKWYLGKAQVQPTQQVSYDIGLEEAQVARDEEVDEFDDDTAEDDAAEDETVVESADEVSDEED